MNRPKKYTELSEIDFQKKPEQRAQHESFETAEKIQFKTQYTEQDLNGLSHVKFVSGFAPFLGGPYSSMSVSYTHLTLPTIE